ncbi:MAG: hypothetical protein IPN71_15630 [Fibrobacteres bacterium]|nr:hypothetical protein [Fibrobacterota bacterium]
MKRPDSNGTRQAPAVTIGKFILLAGKGWPQGSETSGSRCLRPTSRLLYRKAAATRLGGTLSSKVAGRGRPKRRKRGTIRSARGGTQRKKIEARQPPAWSATSPANGTSGFSVPADGQFLELLDGRLGTSRKTLADMVVLPPPRRIGNRHTDGEAPLELGTKGLDHPARTPPASTRCPASAPTAMRAESVKEFACAPGRRTIRAERPSTATKDAASCITAATWRSLSFHPGRRDKAARRRAR